MKSLVISVLLIGVTACSSEPVQNSATHDTPGTAVIPSLPVTYWPLDNAVERTDTVLQGEPKYRISVATTCLNDSAVVNRVTEDRGTVLDVSHNYQSEVTVLSNQQPYLHAWATKAAFAAVPEIKALGPLSELFFSRTTFQRRENDAFIFVSRVGVPDSDIFSEVEWSLEPQNHMRFRKVLKQESEE